MATQLKLLLLGAACLSFAACPPAPRTAETAREIVNLERAALDRWIRADPDGYLGLYAQDVNYFDPFRPRRIDGLNALTAQLAPMRGVKLPFTDQRYEMLNPLVRVEGNLAILTFNLANYAKVAGNPTEVALSRWNATEVYQRTDTAWHIIHAHWSFTQPTLAPPPAR